MEQTTFDIENKYMISFCEKTPLSIERGSGVMVWDECGNEYLDFTSGWAVTSLGYSHPVITNAIIKQCSRIIHNPNSGLTFSPSRANALLQLQKVLPHGVNKVFFTNSGAEANDAAMKLARKITQREKILSARRSFHGRTLAATSATGQSVQRDRYNVLVPNHSFFILNDKKDFDSKLDTFTAAVIIEPIQGEGGVHLADIEFLKYVATRCKENGTLLIIDEIQTGFFRAGPAFLSKSMGITPDFLTMAKGIAGGFPFGAVAVNDAIVSKLEIGDHGGTYNGNPLGCAIVSAVVSFMVENDIGHHVKVMGDLCLEHMLNLQKTYPGSISEIRGKGLLWAIEFTKKETAVALYKSALGNGLILNLKHGNIIRIFPALIIEKSELEMGFEIIKKSLN